jgi:uncharacterized spore protein YtfJ
MNPQDVLTEAQDALNTKRVFGEPMHSDGTTIIPVATVGGGGGGGTKANDQAGVGFGLGAKPAGVFVVKNGDATWKPAINVNLIVLGGQLLALTGLIMLPFVVKQLRKP